MWHCAGISTQILNLAGKKLPARKKSLRFCRIWGLNPQRIAGTGGASGDSWSRCGRDHSHPGRYGCACRSRMPAASRISRPSRGSANACGHDGHMAMLLGVAMVLVEMREQLPGSVRLLFQPSEEKFPGGALSHDRKPARSPAWPKSSEPIYGRRCRWASWR